MKVKDILALENDVTRDYGTAILIRENGGWMRAYEWSAHLLHHMLEDEPERLKPTRKVSGLLADGLIMVGFKDTSAGKYVGNVELGDAEVTYLKVCEEGEYNEETCGKMLKEWKAGFDFSKKKNPIPSDEHEYTYEEIVDAILKYNVERKTLIDDVNFISELKEKCKHISS